MDDSFLWKNKPLLFGSLLPLMDNLYARTQQLQKTGFQAFIIAEEYLSEFATCQNDIDEYHKLIVESRKESISGYTYVSEWITQKKNEAFSVFQNTKKPWDREFTVIGKNISRAKHINERAFQQLLFAYKEKSTMLWCQELACLNPRYYKQIELPEKKAKRIVYRNVLDAFSSETGLQHIKKLSTPNLPIYGKNLIDDYWLCLDYDPKHLDYNTIATLKGYTSSPSLNMRCSLIYRPNLTFHFSKCKGVSVEFTLFFPIWSAIGYDYKSFCSLRELEGLSKVNVVLFRMIQPEIESAFKKTLKNLLQLDL